MGLFKRAGHKPSELARPAGIRQARRLALELAGLAPVRVVDVMSRGIVLEVGETGLRECDLWLAEQAGMGWSRPVTTRVLLTDRRLLVTMPDRRVESLWWGSVIGFHVDLKRGACIMDYGDGFATLLTGPDAGSVAVLGVAALYGVAALTEHPGIAPLRDVCEAARTC